MAKHAPRLPAEQVRYCKPTIITRHIPPKTLRAFLSPLFIHPNDTALNNRQQKLTRREAKRAFMRFINIYWQFFTSFRQEIVILLPPGTQKRKWGLKGFAKIKR
ncbi:reverse transcriptase [Salmonella enterica]|nr:reverse transcriptase [Salmonella enterica subsp. enterica]EJF6725252.1 reverse transcriptase [Salmonella enterica]